MTIREILEQIIIEAGDTPKEINRPAEELFSILNFKMNIDDYIPDDKAEALLAKLRKNLSSVRKFLQERERFYETHTDFLGGYDDQTH